MENMEFIVPLEKWYLENKRDLPWRNTTDPYVIWISEVILQQTRVIQGLDYFNRFMTRFPDVASLAEAEEDEVLKENIRQRQSVRLHIVNLMLLSMEMYIGFWLVFSI